jgi:FkbH-like protein
MLNNPEFETFSVTLSDKFGHYGLISLVIVRIGQDGTGFIDTWLMSCRVLKRTVEAWLMNHIADRLKERGVGILYGEYLPTSKNKLVADLLPKLGFETTGECTYQLELNKYSNLHSNIKDHEHHY